MATLALALETLPPAAQLAPEDRLELAFSVLCHQRLLIRAQLDLELKTIPLPPVVPGATEAINALAKELQAEISALTRYMVRKKKEPSAITLKDIRKVVEIMSGKS